MLVMSKQKTFLILDGNALLHRAWHAVPQTMTTSDGTVINAAYGFTNILERMLDLVKPDEMAVAWDLPGKTFRHDEFEAYKATRVKKEQELYDQIPIIQSILTDYGIPSLSVPGYEADDILGTIAELNKKHGIKTMIVTGDMDALQLVDDTTHGLYFVKGISETKTYDPAAVRERYGFDPLQLIDYKAIAGDSSDNIPGIAGIGEKGAKELIAQFGTIEGIYEAVEKHPEMLKPALLKKLAGQKKHAMQMKRLVTIVRDVKLPKFDAEVKPRDPAKLVKKFRALEFRTLLKKYEHDLDDAPTPREQEGRSMASSEAISNVALKDLGTDKLAIVLESQAEDLFGATLRSVSLADGESTCTIDLPKADDLEAIKQKLAKAKLIIGHDIKAMMHALKMPVTDFASHVRHSGKLFDTMIAAYLLNPAARGYELSMITQQAFGQSRTDVGALLLLHKKLGTELAKEELTKIMEEIEMPLLPILYDMEVAGVKLDTDFLSELSKTMNADLTKLTKKIIKEAGREFNVNSPSQLAEVLFEDLQIPNIGIKRTKTGYSTAADELEKITDLHPIVPMISEYRELAKLIGTYVDALPSLVARDGRLHTTFNQTIASTGRLSSTNPNLQNIPIRTEQGRAIRKAFIAEKGNVLLALDYSQIELRIAAMLAKDKPFLQAFKDGADIHTRTAAEVWDLPEDQVTKDQRRAAKAVNFGILYGMGARNLAKSTGLTLQEAKQFIEKYFEIHHAIKDYIDETKTKAHTDGFVQTLFGRKRYFPEINSGVPVLIAQAERMAVNMPIQGTQADLIKMAMVDIGAWMEKEQVDAKMLLQVHDELVFEVPKTDAEALGQKIKSIMEHAATFDVPIIAEVKIGKNWGEMEG